MAAVGMIGHPFLRFLCCGDHASSGCPKTTTAALHAKKRFPCQVQFAVVQVGNVLEIPSCVLGADVVEKIRKLSTILTPWL